VTVVTNARAFYTTRAAAGASGARHSLRPLFSEGRTISSNLAQTCCEIAKLCLQMMLFEIDSGGQKAPLRPCPPSIGSLIQNVGHAFLLRSSSFALRASEDRSSYGGRFCPSYALRGGAHTLAIVVSRTAARRSVFRRESGATSRLSHPRIVRVSPVLVGLGACRPVLTARWAE
jgi:hypothetical protein